MPPGPVWEGRPQTLADDSGAAFLKAVLGIGGNAAQVIGDSKGSYC